MIDDRNGNCDYADRPRGAVVYYNHSGTTESAKATCLGILAACACYLGWTVVIHIDIWFLINDLASTLTLVPVYAGMLFVHEIIHAIFAKHVSKAAKVWLQGWERGTVIVRAKGLVLREKYVLELLAPFALLSFAMPAIVVLFVPEFGWIALFVAVFNALSSGGDVQSAWAALTRCPAGALVDGDGDEAYWVPETTKATAACAGSP